MKYKKIDKVWVARVLLCVISSLLAHMPYLRCMEVVEPLQSTRHQKMRDIIIISNDEVRSTEYFYESTLWYLVRAINEQVVPILVSIELWNDFVRKRNYVHKGIEAMGTKETD